MAQASASYSRIADGAGRAGRRRNAARCVADLRGDIALADVVVKFGEKAALKDVSLSVQGRHQDGGDRPDGGGQDAAALPAHRTAEARRRDASSTTASSIDDYDKKSLHQQVGFVFQDAIIFNLTLRENIALQQDRDATRISRRRSRPPS